MAAQHPVGKIPVYSAPYALTPARDEHQRGLAARGQRALASIAETGDVPVRMRYLTDRQIQVGGDPTLEWRQAFLEGNNAADGYPQPVFLP